MKDYYSIISLQSNMSQLKTGFKLQSESEKDEEKSIAASSFNYKQRIDSMFDDTRSMISGVSINKNTYNTNYYRYNPTTVDIKNGAYNKSLITNEVQNKINKMFQEVNSTEMNGSSDVAKYQKFPVSYMGSITLHEKITSLRELQLPLKELYFNYIRNGRTSCLVHGSLEITQSGLKVKNYGNKVNRPSEQLNPFSSIAVWAAVKFVFRKKESYAIMNKNDQTEYAFMPLIADPESVDKISLYQNLSLLESNLLMEGDNSDNPPLFIVVMRESSVSASFDCHGFICSSSNDAIILAANLYTALVRAIPSSPLNNQNYSEPKDNSSEVLPRSIRALRSRHSSYNSTVMSHVHNCSDDTPRTDSPRRPPRKIKPNCSSESCSNVSSEETSKPPSVPYSKSKLARKDALSLDGINHIKSTPTADVYFEHTKAMSSLVSSTSKQYLQSVKNKSESEIGDILTKVAIPRSKSFLNASGPFFSRYTKGLDGLGIPADAQTQRKTNIVSPLGLNELFQEFKQEGLYSMNDILDAIIDPDGMSFNDLKPIYKEFVLKLALTLTKDELYQRSKSIMQKQKHKKRQMDRRDNIKKSFITGNALKKALRRSVTNLKYTKYKQNSLEFTSILFPSSGSDEFIRKRSTSYSDKQISISAMSSVSSREKRALVRRQRSSTNSSQNKKSGRSRRTKSPNTYSKRRDGQANSDKSIKKSYLHNSSSGYISCSECSYSSDSCTCSSAERCYCSLGTKRNNSYNNCSRLQDISPCECDTDSCFESDKCYCNQSSIGRSFHNSKNSECIPSIPTGSRINGISEHINIFEGIEGATTKDDPESQVINGLEAVRIEGHKPPWPDNSIGVGVKTGQNGKADPRKRRDSTGSTHDGSVRDARRNRTGNFPPNQNKFNKDKAKTDEGRSEKKVLVVSARDPSGKVVYMGRTRAKSMPQDLDSISTTDDALCVKKTAEIAALFSASNDDIIYNTLEPPENFNEKYFRSNYVESNLESSLGYLP